MNGRVHDVEPGEPLQAVLDAAAEGDVVSLAAGVHRGPIAIRRGVTVVGSDGADCVVLEGDGRERVIAVEPDHDHAVVTLSGLVVRGGVSGLGAGVAVLGFAELRASACVFEDNRARDAGGGALFASAGRVDLRDCVLQRNVAGRGGALLLAEAALATATGCVFRDNEAEAGGAVRLQGGAFLVALHCTFADDRATGGGATVDLAGALAGRPTLRLANSLVLAGGPGSLRDTADAPGRVIVASSVVPPDWRAAAGDLVVEGASAFEAAARGERGGWPTVAAGDVGAGAADWTLTLLGDALVDLTGAHRLEDGRIDVGAVDGPPGGAA